MARQNSILSLPLPPWITATASISLCLSIVAQSSPSYSMSTSYFEVIKTCFLLSLISIYYSLSICFNCSWNFLSLWLWVALDLSFFVFVFMEFCWLVVVGCSGIYFYFILFYFADFHIFFFFLCCQIYGKEESWNFCQFHTVVGNFFFLYSFIAAQYIT